MNIYPVKIPYLIKSIFHKWIWCFNTSEKHIYLTFDDGPIPEITPWVLEQLNNYNAKATFFCIGDNIKKHPEVFHQIIEKGHRVGNHTYHHINGWKHTTTTYINNCHKTELLLPNSEKTKIFRPPYGKIKREQAKILRKKGYKIIMWEVLSGDFDTSISADQCIKNVLGTVNKGSIVVFHDSKKAFPRLQEALPIILKELHQKGYVFKTIP